MNVSEKYKSVWIAPERTGSRKVAEILSYYDFKSNGKLVFNHSNGYSHSHQSVVDDKYADYNLIVSIRNPYGKTYSLFRNFFNNRQSQGKDLFKKFLLEELPKGKMNNMILNPILNKNPDYIVRLEHMREDLSKIPFIFDILTEKQLDLMTQHGKQIEDFEVYYDQESKDIVYEYCKHLFILGGYEK